MLNHLSKQTKVLLGLRVLTILTCITAVAGLAWATTKEHGISTDGLGHVFDEMGAVCIGISGLWSIIALILIIVLDDRIHPGVIIGLDVTIACLMLSIGIVLATSPVNQASDLACGEKYYDSCDSAPHRTVVFRFIGCIFCFVNFVCHTAFVVVASKACHQRRKHASRSDAEFKGAVA
ncbi:hypothetical protein FQN54_009913 [Arachnomyces sp. PD_36]|nr:hypothetical protein FQN54_009913 [Arachnomyces sp. PD_36]